MIFSPRPACRFKALQTAVEVAGTWDYKWPKGCRIRVALQTPPRHLAGDLEAVWTRIQDLANRWHAAVASFAPDRLDDVWPSSTSVPLGIGFSFLDTPLEAPMGAASFLGDSHKSPFTRGDRGFSRYDVLVSLEDLPVFRVDPFRFNDVAEPEGDRPPEEGLERVLMPMSELGAYARRADFGSPTIFLGRFGEAVTKGWSLLEYLHTALGEHATVQQFGHVLGLANEHQNPAYGVRSAYRPPAELAAAIQSMYGISQTPTDEEIQNHILSPWPGDRAFSDWAEPVRALEDLESVMTHARHDKLLKAPGTLAPAGLVTSPTRADVSNLVNMYGTTRTGQAYRANVG